MKILGKITREMYWDQNKVIITPELTRHIVPIDGLYMTVDVGRLVLLDDNGVVCLESFKDKKLRETGMYLIEKEENRPIINE